MPPAGKLWTGCLRRNRRTAGGASRCRTVGDAVIGCSLFAFPEDAATLRNGIFAALGDINGDGFADLIFGGGPGGAPRVFILSGQLFTTASPSLFTSPVANFFVAGNSSDRGGVRVAAKDADGDLKGDLAVGSGGERWGAARGRRRTCGSISGRTSRAAASRARSNLNVFGGGVLTDGVFVG